MRRRRGGDVHGAPWIPLRTGGGRGGAGFEAAAEAGLGKSGRGYAIRGRRAERCDSQGARHGARRRFTRGRTRPRAEHRRSPSVCNPQRHAFASPQVDPGRSGRRRSADRRSPRERSHGLRSPPSPRSGLRTLRLDPSAQTPPKSGADSNVFRRASKGARNTPRRGSAAFQANMDRLFHLAGMRVKGPADRLLACPSNRFRPLIGHPVSQISEFPPARIFLKKNPLLVEFIDN